MSDVVGVANTVLEFVRRELGRFEAGENPSSKSVYEYHVDQFAAVTKDTDVPFSDHFAYVRRAIDLGETDDAVEYLEEVVDILEAVIDEGQ